MDLNKIQSTPPAAHPGANFPNDYLMVKETSKEQIDNKTL